MKVDVEYLKYFWPMRHYMISCGSFGGEKNIITLSFCMPVSKKPPLVACTVGRNTHSLEMIRENDEFVMKNLRRWKITPQDVYDDLRSDRPYKDAFSHEKAAEIIISDSGTHFDPVVVNAFIELKDEFRSIYEKSINQDLEAEFAY